VLIRVRFAGVNPLDNNLLGRLTAASSYPFVASIDFAGVAERVPAGDHGLQVGDRVFGMARTHGSYAEYTAVAPAAAMEPLAKIPDGVADDQAAAHALHAAHPDGVDAVLDLFNGPDAIRRDAGVIRPGGHLVSTIFAADEGWFAKRQITAHNHSSRANPLISPQGLSTVGQLLADGTITARIGSTVDLDGAGQVLEELRHGGLPGKAIIRL
jgi:NADPH:quinone reductase-like Zn-dependent oxidoreductase